MNKFLLLVPNKLFELPAGFRVGMCLNPNWGFEFSFVKLTVWLWYSQGMYATANQGKMNSGQRAVESAGW